MFRVFWVFWVCLVVCLGAYGFGVLGCLGCLGWGSGVQEFRCLGVCGLGVLGFGRTKTTRNVTWGSILTPSRKTVQNSRNIKVGQKLRQKVRSGSGRITQKEWTKNGAKCNMVFGRMTKIYLNSFPRPRVPRIALRPSVCALPSQ